VDAIFKLTADYKADKFERKVNLGVGAYRTDEGKPFVLPSVQKAKERIAADTSLDHEYLPITGLPEFTSAAAKLVFGSDSKAITQGRVSSVQTISGTGANFLGASFLDRFYGPWQKPGAKKTMYISDPTWANHKAIFGTNLGLNVVDYPYYDPKTIGLDFDGFVNALKSAPEYSVFLLHACAHNPTGVDPTRDQWKQIADIFKQRHLFAFFDCAYQGFASGDLDNDGWAVRYFTEENIPLLLCQSFAKNAGLYGERIGALHVVGKDQKEGKSIFSQLSVLQRSEISNPPTFGARIVSLLLNDQELYAQWKKDIETMAHRIIDMRKTLYSLLTEKYKTPGNWDHILSQIGMFSFTGLNPEQVKAMVETGHVYMTSNGRISMAGLNTNNVEYFAKTLDKAVRGIL